MSTKKFYMMTSFAAVALAATVLSTPSSAEAATCGGEPWTFSAFLAGSCAGAGAKVLPGDNSEGKINVTPSGTVSTSPTDNTEQPGGEDPDNGGTDPGTENPGGGGEDPGTENPGTETPGNPDNGGPGSGGPGHGHGHGNGHGNGNGHGGGHGGGRGGFGHGR